MPSVVGVADVHAKDGVPVCLAEEFRLPDGSIATVVPTCPKDGHLVLAIEISSPDGRWFHASVGPWEMSHLVAKLPSLMQGLLPFP